MWLLSSFRFRAAVCSCTLLVLTSARALAHPPSGIVVDTQGNVYFHFEGAGGRIVRLSPDGFPHTFSPSRQDAEPPDAHKLAIDRRDNLYLMGWRGIWRVSPEEKVSVFLPLRGFNVDAVPIGAAPNSSETESTYVHWNTPLAVDSKGNLYCVNFEYESRVARILKVDPKGKARVLAGGKWGHRDGKGADARFRNLFDAGMAIGPGDVLYLTDGGTRTNDGATCVRRITSDGQVTTIAGTAEPDFADGKGQQARFSSVIGLAVDNQSNIYVADSRNRRMRKINRDGVVSTVAGSGIEGHADGPALQATFTRPTGLALGTKGEVYILDERRVRKLTPAGEVSTIYNRR